MKTLILSFIFALFSFSITAQTCLPGGITFTTQQQIDDFATDYPGCTEIEGDVTIYESVSENITNLNGLENLKSIGGSLVISENNSLMSIIGLENVSAIGRLFIDRNKSLTSLAGFESLSSVGSELNIWNNNSLTSMTGLGSLTSIGNRLDIWNNNSLMSMSGFESLNSVGGDFHIRENDLLMSLTGLENLSSIVGRLIIENNDFLKDLTGLDSLSSVGGYLAVKYNRLINNLTGLKSLSSIGGSLFVHVNDSLTSMIGLENLTSIGSDVEIYSNGSLASLAGLGSVSSIGGDLGISNNDFLTSLTGLGSVSTIGGNLNIDHNDALTSLTGLEGVSSIGDYLKIKNNASLSSLTGIQNIDPTTIKTQSNSYYDLSIWYNPNLSECEVQSICDFLVIPGGTTSIDSNAIGCNTQAEIEDACQMVSTSKVSPKKDAANLNVLSSKINLYPNPTTNKFTLDFSETDVNNANITILDLSGAVQYSTMKSTNEKSIAVNLERLNSGLYLVKIHSEKYGAFYKKLMLLK